LRFLLRRIDRTRNWRSAVALSLARGSLRRQTILLPLRADFTEILIAHYRGSRAIGQARGATLLRWAGGSAIAAAVAVVALVVTRPQGEM